MELEQEISALKDNAQAQADVVTTNENKEDEFLKDVLGPAAAELPRRKDTGPSPYEDKPNNPHNKPMHSSVTRKFITPGGKEMVAVHDPMGTFWHIEFTTGGQIPDHLTGSYTSDVEAKKVIAQYIAKKELEAEE